MRFKRLGGGVMALAAAAPSLALAQSAAPRPDSGATAWVEEGGVGREPGPET